MSDDLHAPTSAGPQPETAWAPVGDGVTGAPGQAAGDPLAALAERPEVLVGAAFAGGVLAALILKRLGRR